jgi:peptide/nickel transport system permease protein
MKPIIKKQSAGVIISVFILGVFLLMALFASFIAPHNPQEANQKDRLQDPSWKNPFGTDHLGRCILSRINLVREFRYL